MADRQSRAADIEQSDLFVAGEGDYHTYRIPSLIVTKRGVVLAFCEGRKKGASDSGDIDLLLRRSSDGGRTWSKPQVVWDDGANTCGNPCPVVDHQTGAVWLLLTHNLGSDNEAKIVAGTSQAARTVWVSKSDDDGATWTKPIDITKDTKKPEWTWYATGPGVGIQLRLGKHKGRLVIPCDHKTREPNVTFHSHVIYSDDHGRTWKLGGATDDGTNECQVIERGDGSLLLNMRRSKSSTATTRALATSDDGGLTWSKLSHDKTLVEPRCQASLIRVAPRDPSAKSRTLFANPANPRERKQMTLRISEDDGATWPTEHVLHASHAGYSALAALPDGTVLCLYECGEKNYRQYLRLARIAKLVPATSAASAVPPGWKLVWNDEFETAGAPDAKKWGYDLGGHGWGNRELQYYTDRRENSRVEDGRLIVEARQESHKGKNYTSARLVTKRKGDWQYGRIEVRAKLPPGRGTWPAIWMLPTVDRLRWPDDGEIDIMEHVGFDPGVVHASIHCKRHNHVAGTQKTAKSKVADCTKEFHVYAVQWSRTKIDAFIDDKKHFTYERPADDKASWPFDGKFHLLLNVAVGGNWGGQKGIDDAVFPAKLEVDYVRVYEPEKK